MRFVRYGSWYEGIDKDEVLKCPFCSYSRWLNLPCNWSVLIIQSGSCSCYRFLKRAWCLMPSLGVIVVAVAVVCLMCEEDGSRRVRYVVLLMRTLVSANEVHEICVRISCFLWNLISWRSCRRMVFSRMVSVCNLASKGFWRFPRVYGTFNFLNSWGTLRSQGIAIFYWVIMGIAHPSHISDE